MLEQVKLENVQSHKDVILDFVRGINVIKGSSDQGKTAILRGLNECVNNRPTGTSMNSKWNKDEKKQYLSQHSVRVKTNGRFVHRIRDKGFNGYKIYDRDIEDAEIIDAIGTDVPEQVSKIFNLSEVNIQRQLDSPFLISESPAEVARFLNKIIRLDLIDKVLSAAEQKRKQTNKDILRTETEIEDLEKKIGCLEWTEEAQGTLEVIKRRSAKCEKNKDRLREIEGLVWNHAEQACILKDLSFVGEAEKISEAIEELDEKIEGEIIETNKIFDLVESWELNEGIIARTPDLSKALEIMSEAEALDKQIEEKIDEADKASELIESWNLNEEIVSSSQNFDAAVTLMDEADDVDRKIINLYDKKQDLENLIDVYKNNSAVIAECDGEIKRLEKSMPDNCPSCNQKLPDSMEAK